MSPHSLLKPYPPSRSKCSSTLVLSSSSYYIPSKNDLRRRFCDALMRYFMIQTFTYQDIYKKYMETTHVKCILVTNKLRLSQQLIFTKGILLNKYIISLIIFLPNNYLEIFNLSIYFYTYVITQFENCYRNNLSKMLISPLM